MTELKVTKSTSRSIKTSYITLTTFCVEVYVLEETIWIKLKFYTYLYQN